MRHNVLHGSTLREVIDFRARLIHRFTSHGWRAYNARHMAANNSQDRFQWNSGSWFGAVIGSTAWMLLAGIFVARASTPVSLVTLGLFLAINLIAVLLWSRRATLPPFLCMQFILVLIGLASFIIVFIIDRSGHWSAIQVGGFKVPALLMYVAIGLGVPVLVGLMWLQRWIHSLPHTEDEDG